MFCYKLFLFEDDNLLAQRRRREKAGDDEAMALLIDAGCVVEYT